MKLNIKNKSIYEWNAISDKQIIPNRQIRKFIAAHLNGQSSADDLYWARLKLTAALSKEPRITLHHSTWNVLVLIASEEPKNDWLLMYLKDRCTVDLS